MSSRLRTLLATTICSAVTCLPAVAQGPDATRVAILMFDGVQIIDFAGPYEVFGQAGFDVFTVSADGAPITAAMNLVVDPDYDFASAPDADIVLIPGGHIHDAMADAATLEYITAQAAHAEQVLSVCTGSFVLAATGLLDGKTATTFHSSFGAMEETFPNVEIVRDRRWVDTGKLVTSAGLASGIDAALHVVAEVRGLDAARSVAMNLEYAWSPGDRDGFIRGALADTHTRLPSKWQAPEGTQLHMVTSLGDEHQWRTVLHVMSPLSANAFIDYVRELAARDETLDLSPRSNAGVVAWRYADAAGDWELRFTANEDADAGFELVSELVALD